MKITIQSRVRAPLARTALGGGERWISRSALVLAAVALAACAPGSAAPPSPQVAGAGTLFARVPAQVAGFNLTERDAVEALSSDSLYRFSDGTAARVTVIIYEPGEDVKDEPEAQEWVAREGSKFQQVQEIRRRRGQIASYAEGFSDTSRVSAGDERLLEHAAGMPVRMRNGDIFVELQYLYLIDGKFVKVRATVPEDIWRETRVPVFARELAGRLVGRQ
jgi:hypothetical protein